MSSGVCEKCGWPKVAKEKSIFYLKCVNIDCEKCDSDFKIWFMCDLPFGGKVISIRGFLRQYKDVLTGERKGMEDFQHRLDICLRDYLVLKIGYAEIDESKLKKRHGLKIIKACRAIINELERPFKELKRAVVKEGSVDKGKVCDLIDKIYAKTQKLLEYSEQFGPLLLESAKVSREEPISTKLLWPKRKRLNEEASKVLKEF